MPRFPEYEVDDKAFPAEAYMVQGYRGVAWRVYGWEIEHVIPEPWQDEETGEWYDYYDEPEERRTGRVVCVMVGDDRRFTFDPEEVTPLGDLDYCASCGQIGCEHDGRDREEEEEE